METPQSNNLQLFKTLFIVKGVLNIFLTIFLAAYFLFSRSLFENMQTHADGPDFSILANLFSIFVIVFLLFSIFLSIGTIVAGVSIGKMRHFQFIIVMAVLNSFTGILGILLCVFTVIELNKLHVRKLFYRKTTSL